MKSIHLHIDRIVVDGLPHSGRKRFAAALEEKLREWAESGVAEQFAANTRQRISSLDAGRMRPGATPSQAAAQIVETLGQSVGRARSSRAPAAGGFKHV